MTDLPDDVNDVADFPSPPNPTISEMKSVIFRDKSLSKVFIMAGEWLKKNYCEGDICDVIHDMDASRRIHFLSLYLDPDA